jgi:C1A family cysteine protease
MIHKYTYIKPDPIYKFAILKKITPAKSLPISHSLYNYLPAVKTQGNLGSCTGCSLGTAVETLENIYKLKKFTPLSALFLYYCERDISNTVEVDCGSSLLVGIRCLQLTGICPLKDWVYNISKFKIRPPPHAYKNALKFRIKNAFQVPTDLISIKTILMKRPIVIGIMVYESFENISVSKTGIIPYPDVLNEQLYGGHAMCIYGYDDTKECVIVRNSWGTEWGNKGDCYLPYSYLLDDTLNIEMWTCISFTNNINNIIKQKK